MKVLVDSSVWINYFKNGDAAELDTFLAEDLVITNDIILCELIPLLSHQNKPEVVESLNSLEKQRINIEWDAIIQYQIINLKNGINRVGIPDLILLQQVIENNLALYSYDKHFKLMEKQFRFNLIS